MKRRSILAALLAAPFSGAVAAKEGFTSFTASAADLEEGEWTPTILWGEGDQTEWAPATGRYTRIGKVVHVTATLVLKNGA